MMQKHVSDERLNAYIDGELDTTERLHLMEALRTDPELASRACQLQKVKDMVQLAYTVGHDVAQPQTVRPRRAGWGAAVAASLLFFFGVFGGWFASQKLDPTPSLLEIAKTARFNDAAEAGKPWRLMLHVSSGDTHRYGVMLREAERLLRASAESGNPVQIEIVTNGPGLLLLSNRDDPLTRKLQTLAREYDNLDLRACERAIRRYRAINGKDIELIPEADTVRSAMHEVIRRQQEGWAYINI